MPFPLTLPQFNSKLIDVFSISNDTPYFRNAKKKWVSVTDPKKDPVERVFFSVLSKLVVYLFKNLRIDLFIH